MDNNDWLLSAHAQVQQKKVVELFASGHTQLQIIKKLKDSLNSSQISQLLEQHDLRVSGKKKFSRADHMYFTRTQLEQATSEVIACYKAARYGRFNEIADLCCGIGGDSLALAKNSVLHAIDTDAQVLAMAKHNIAIYGHESVTHHLPAESFDVSHVDAFHLDPDRRIESVGKGTRQRTTQAEMFSPNLEQIRQLEIANPNFGIKLAPASASWTGEYEIEFIGHERECKQQMVWSGKLTTQPGRTATVLDNSDRIESFHCGEDEFQMSRSILPGGAPVAKYIYDPHACLLAADLLPVFAQQNGLNLVDARSQYVTSDSIVESNLMSCFEVKEVLPADQKKIKQYLSSVQAGKLELKKRSVHNQLFENLKRLKLKGDRSLTIVLSNTLEGLRAIVCERIQNSSQLESA